MLVSRVMANSEWIFKSTINFQHTISLNIDSGYWIIPSWFPTNQCWPVTKPVLAYETMTQTSKKIQGYGYQEHKSWQRSCLEAENTTVLTACLFSGFVLIRFETSWDKVFSIDICYRTTNIIWEHIPRRIHTLHLRFNIAGPKPG
jgi:hypothetical protein